MANPAHQDIDRLTESLDKRADVEGLARGAALTRRRKLTRWGIRWSLGLALALLLAQAEASLWWVPLGTALLALVALGTLLMGSNRLSRMIATARARL